MMTKQELEQYYLQRIRDRYDRYGVSSDAFVLRSLARRYSEMTKREWNKAWTTKGREFRDGEISVEAMRVLFPFLHFGDETTEDLHKRQADGARRAAQRDIRERNRAMRGVE